MKRYYSILFIAFIGIFLASCESDLVVHDKKENKMVIHGILSSDKPFCVKVTKTRNILNESDKVKVLSNASVLVYDSKNNIYQLLFDEEEGVYKSHLYPKPGEKYRLKVLHKDFPEVTSETCMPNLSSASVKAEFEFDEEGIKEVAILDLVIDREAVGNYFIWELFYHNNVLDKSVKASISSIDENTDNILPDRDIIQHRIFLKDRRGIDRALKSKFTTNEISEKNVSSASIRLLALSEDAYEYYRSLEIYKKTANSKNFNNVEVHSNIKGGLGVFGAVNETTIVISK